MGYSQYGEDEILSQRFARRSPGFFVEVGAGNGRTLSNTLLLEELGWQGILIEPNPVAAQACRDIRKAVVVEKAVTAPGEPPTLPFQVVDGIPDLSSLSLGTAPLKYISDLQRVKDNVRIRTIEVRTSTLDKILTSLSIEHIDFMSIDVEGHERDVLRGFDLQRWAPEVLILERNVRWPDLGILRDLHRSGYAFERRTGVNDWYSQGGPLASWWRVGRMIAFHLGFCVSRPILRTIRRLRDHSG